MSDNNSNKTKKSSIFEIGTWVVYPSHGVGRLENVEKFEIDGGSVEFFVISFNKNKLILKLPVEKAISSGLRKLLSKQDMQTALDILSQKSRKKKMMWSKRAQEYEAKINSGDPVAIAEVLRDLYKDGGEAVQSFSERQIFQNAIDRLAREIAVLEEIQEEEAVQKLKTLLKAA
ncbi:MAG: CarD family transcriptional regulator [Holosporales bacterium]|jgi:CarD family transcriptional regulator|nr:CarD family transcriptional regulator [Holosporales bacterium]